MRALRPVTCAMNLLLCVVCRVPRAACRVPCASCRVPCALWHRVLRSAVQQYLVACRCEPLSLVIVTRDRFGNRCGANNSAIVSVRVRPPLVAAHPPAVRIVSQADGTHEVSFVPEVRGRHTIAISIDGRPIQGSDCATYVH